MSSGARRPVVGVLLFDRVEVLGHYYLPVYPVGQLKRELKISYLTPVSEEQLVIGIAIQRIVFEKLDLAQ